MQINYCNNCLFFKLNDSMCHLHNVKVSEIDEICLDFLNQYEV